MDLSFDTRELITRLVKYLAEGLVVGLAAYLIPAKAIRPSEAFLIALVAAAIFSILDLVSPSIGSSARNGAGLGVGFGLVGFP